MFFSFPSQICHLSRKREAGRPFGLKPTLISYLLSLTHVSCLISLVSRLIFLASCLLPLMLLIAHEFLMSHFSYLLSLISYLLPLVLLIAHEFLMSHVSYLISRLSCLLSLVSSLSSLFSYLISLISHLSSIISHHLSLAPSLPPLLLLSSPAPGAPLFYLHHSLPLGGSARIDRRIREAKL